MARRPTTPTKCRQQRRAGDPPTTAPTIIGVVSTTPTPIARRSRR
jgi:hypothetical protein